MERLIYNYRVAHAHELRLTNAEEFSAFNESNIRVIIDCASQEPIVTPLDRTAIRAVSYDSSNHELVINLHSSFPPLTVGGEVTVKIDDSIKPATEAAATANKNAILDAIGGSSGEIGLKPMMQIIMQGFNFSEELAEMVALTDTEILNQYDGYEDEGQHIEGIADQTYGHLVPAQVTIDDEPFTFYQERTYADYGYSVLYKNGVAIDTTTTHPQEDDELTTTNN